MKVTKRIEVDKPKKALRQVQWSNKQKLSAVQAYLILGKVPLVAASIGIPEETVYKWRLTTWWKELEEEIRKSSKIELSGKLQNIISKTIMQLEDRVENGDFFWDQINKQYVRKQINALTCNKIANNLIDKTLILEKEVTKEYITDEGLEDRLHKLRDEMIKFARAKTIEGEIIQTIPLTGNNTYNNNA